MSVTNLQATQYAQYMPIGFPGTPTHIVTAAPYSNIGGLTAQVAQIDIGTIAQATLYTIVVDGVSVGVTTAASGETATTARDKLVTALRVNAQIYSNYLIAAVSTASLSITSRLAGIASPITVSGGSTGYTVNSGAAVAAASALKIPFGVLVARKTGDPFRTCRLPTAAGDIPLGFAIANHSRGIENGDGYISGEAVGVLRDGNILALVEEPVTEDSTPFFRRAANGALTQLGALAGATGTGLTALPGVAFKGNSFSIEGLLACEVSVNLT
jgi:hypothetical protein